MWWKHCIFSHKTLWIATNYFVQSLSFLSPTQHFFPSWNIGSIILLVSITYLALVHNYNTIKYIYFISPRQRAGMPSRIKIICYSLINYYLHHMSRKILKSNKIIKLPSYILYKKTLDISITQNFSFFKHDLSLLSIIWTQIKT